MSEGARAPKRVVDLWDGRTPDVDTTVVYLSGSRRLVSENVQTDLAICLLEAAARTDPVMRALLEEGLEHPSDVVQQTAQRLR